MRRSIYIFTAAAGLLFGLAGCLQLASEPIEYPRPASTIVIAESFVVDLKSGPKEREYLLSTGQSFEGLIESLALISPSLIELTPRHKDIGFSDLHNQLKSFASHHTGQVVVHTPDGTLSSSIDIRLNIHFYLYELAPCGAEFGRRKLDQNGLVTPGFGCAIERNLLLSVSDPSELFPAKRPGESLKNRLHRKK